MRKRVASNIKLSELKGKIKAENYILDTLAPRVEMSKSTLSLKLNGKSDFTGTEIFAMCTELHISDNEIGKYFFPQMFPKETLAV